MPTTKIRPLEEKDFSELADLLSEELQSPPEIWQRRFDMWWINNPWMDPSIQYGWVLEDDKTEIVGFLGNIPIKFQIKGRDDIAAAGTSLYVRPSVRGVNSLQPILAFSRQKNIKLLLNTTANETATKIFPKLGFSDLSAPFNDMEYWYVRDYGKMCDFYVRTNITPHRLLPLIKASLAPIKLVSPFVRWFKDKRKFKLQPDHYKCSLCTYCDDSFTELWNDSKKENATTLCRDAETLNWLYFSKAVAEKRYVIKCIDTRNEKLVGYFVFDIACSEKDIKAIQLKDAYIPQFEEGIFLSLIAFSIDLAKRHDVAASAFWPIDQKMDEILKKQIKIKRKHKRAYLYKFVNEGDESDMEEYEGHEFIPSPIDPDRGIL
ncbi:hypothetical protein ACT9XH_07455 [Methanococcoides methylutens]|uniref:hypothetical protein n=1 Tax=Methanococcoides methylutens TaxID=2226 RepID=UPI0040439AD1